MTGNWEQNANMCKTELDKHKTRKFQNLMTKSAKSAEKNW